MSAFPANALAPPDAVQCKECKGDGCKLCDHRGWFENHYHHLGRKCKNPVCGNPMKAGAVGDYCCMDCAVEYSP